MEIVFRYYVQTVYCRKDEDPGKRQVEKGSEAVQPRTDEHVGAGRRRQGEGVAVPGGLRGEVRGPSKA
jgi:hypothetical protein